MKKIIAALGIFAVLAVAASAMAQSVVSPGYQYQNQYCPALSYNLYAGLNDYYTQGQVTQLQQYLAARGYYQPVTGYFGSITRSNVANFQRQYAVYPITGGVGPLTRAAIARTCGQGGTTGSGTFSLGVPFSAVTGQTLAQYGGQLDFTLNSITASPYTYTTYPGYNSATSATITLGQRCQTGTYCLYYPQQQFTLTPGQTISWMNYSVTLLSLSQNTANFVVTQGGTTQSAPTISSVTPTQGPVGTVVTITGSNFSSSNTVYFGNGGTQNVPSYNGTTITYTIPASIGAVCGTAQLCPQYLQLVTPGTYNLSVNNGYGQSGTVPFVVTQVGSVGGITVSSPSQGQTYSRGQDMVITWGYPVTPNSTQMMLELYSAAGNRIGLVAVSGNTSGSYTWHIPGFPQNYMCTLQYPNGLCGTNIPDGQYYIRVSATNNPLDASPNSIASGQSGTFSMTGAGAGTTGTTITANPQAGVAPLTVTFSLANYTGQYRVDYGDGISASLISGSTAHTYYNRGTYTATFVSDYVCLHSTPSCQIAQQNLGSVTVTVY